MNNAHLVKMSEREGRFLTESIVPYCHFSISTLISNSGLKYELITRLKLLEKEREKSSSHKQWPPSEKEREREDTHTHARAGEMENFHFSKNSLWAENNVLYFFTVSPVTGARDTEPTSQTNRNVHEYELCLWVCVCFGLLLLRQGCRRQEFF